MKLSPPRIEVVPIEKLKPSPVNPRIDHAVGALERSIEQFGYVAPIIVQRKTYRILAGHGRLEALKRKGVEQVPVVVADLTDKQAELYTIADNRLGELSKFDEKKIAEQLRGVAPEILESVGFQPEDLEEMVAKELVERGLKDIDVKAPPRMTWVLVGIPTVRYGEISSMVEKLAATRDTIVETTFNDGRKE